MYFIFKKFSFIYLAPFTINSFYKKTSYNITYHAIMHDLIPIFPCYNTEKNSDSLACCGKVSVPAITVDRLRLTP